MPHPTSAPMPAQPPAPIDAALRGLRQAQTIRDPRAVREAQMFHDIEALDPSERKLGMMPVSPAHLDVVVNPLKAGLDFAGQTALGAGLTQLKDVALDRLKRLFADQGSQLGQ